VAGDIEVEGDDEVEAYHEYYNPDNLHPQLLLFGVEYAQWVNIVVAWLYHLVN
jgi:hypothetical protein